MAQNRQFQPSEPWKTSPAQSWAIDFGAQNRPVGQCSKPPINREPVVSSQFGTTPPMSPTAFHADPKTRLAREVAARQLELLTLPMVHSIYGLPVWALVVCWANSGAFPFMGETPVIWAAAWFGLICVTSLGARLVERAYQARPRLRCHL
jgi:hypothetical protein